MPEPGYAECADAIKTGAIKKVSVSHERLVDIDGTKSKHDPSSEIYANPQILLRKKSKLLEEGTGFDSVVKINNEDSKGHGRKEEEKQKAGLNEKKKRKQGKVDPPEAPPLPARNYSLYLENEEAETVVNDVLDDIKQENKDDYVKYDDAFEVSDTTGKICDNEQCKNTECKEEITEENPKSHSEVDLNLIRENLNDNSAIISKPNISDSYTGDMGNYLEKSKNGSQNSTGCALEQKKSETHDGNVQQGEVSSAERNECFHVTVKDKSGNEKVLRIVEKEESFKVRDKRKVCKVKKNDIYDNCDDLDDDEGNKDSNLCETHQHICDNCIDTKDAKDSACDLDTNMSQNYCTGCYDKVTENSQTNSKENMEESSSFSAINSTNDPLGSPYTQTKDNDPQTGINVSNNVTVVCTDLEKANSETDDHVAETSDKSKTSEDSCSESYRPCALGIFTSCTYHTQKSHPDSDHDLLTVESVKLKLVSVDSDTSDLLDTSDLPKLEINESDLENPFDSSDNSNHSGNELDIANESAAIEKLTNELAHLAVTDSGNTNKSAMNINLMKESANPSENATSEAVESSQSNNFDTHETDDHIISDQNEEGFKDSCSYTEGTTLQVQTEVSDDSAIENNDEGDKMDESNSETEDNKGCDNENKNTSNSAKESTPVYDSLPPSVPFSYQGLYEDTEPTHMSLNEIFSQGQHVFSNVFKAESPTEGSSMIQLRDIPHTEISSSDAPPPRPPPISTDQLQARNSNSSQSSHSTGNTPPEELSPPFRFACQSDGESPPAIPPRMRPDRSTKRPGKHSNLMLF